MQTRYLSSKDDLTKIDFASPIRDLSYELMIAQIDNLKQSGGAITIPSYKKPLTWKDLERARSC